MVAVGHSPPDSARNVNLYFRKWASHEERCLYELQESQQLLTVNVAASHPQAQFALPGFSGCAYYDECPGFFCNRTPADRRVPRGFGEFGAQGRTVKFLSLRRFIEEPLLLGCDFLLRKHDLLLGDLSQPVAFSSSKLTEGEGTSHISLTISQGLPVSKESDKVSELSISICNCSIRLLFARQQRLNWGLVCDVIFTARLKGSPDRDAVPLLKYMERLFQNALFSPNSNVHPKSLLQHTCTKPEKLPTRQKKELSGSAHQSQTPVSQIPHQVQPGNSGTSKNPNTGNLKDRSIQKKGQTGGGKQKQPARSGFEESGESSRAQVASASKDATSKAQRIICIYYHHPDPSKRCTQCRDSPSHMRYHIRSQHGELEAGPGCSDQTTSHWWGLDSERDDKVEVEWKRLGIHNVNEEKMEALFKITWPGYNGPIPSFDTEKLDIVSHVNRNNSIPKSNVIEEQFAEVEDSHFPKLLERLSKHSQNGLYGPVDIGTPNFQKAVQRYCEDRFKEMFPEVLNACFKRRRKALGECSLCIIDKERADQIAAVEAMQKNMQRKPDGRGAKGAKKTYAKVAAQPSDPTLGGLAGSQNVPLTQTQYNNPRFTVEAHSSPFTSSNHGNQAMWQGDDHNTGESAFANDRNFPSLPASNSQILNDTTRTAPHQLNRLQRYSASSLMPDSGYPTRKINTDTSPEPPQPHQCLEIRSPTKGARRSFRAYSHHQRRKSATRFEEDISRQHSGATDTASRSYPRSRTYAEAATDPMPQPNVSTPASSVTRDINQTGKRIYDNKEPEVDYEVHNGNWSFQDSDLLDKMMYGGAPDESGTWNEPGDGGDYSGMDVDCEARFGAFADPEARLDPASELPGGGGSGSRNQAGPHELFGMLKGNEFDPRFLVDTRNATSNSDARSEDVTSNKRKRVQP